MLFDVSRKLFSRSDRVKGTNFHPTEPWLLTSLYNSSVNIYNHETGTLVKTFKVSNVPLRVFNYNTHEKVVSFEAHPDYIRCLAVHLTASIVVTGSDDMTIKAWDWDKRWKCIQVYEGHTHYIMSIAFNPKYANTFVSACLDRTVKMWSLGSGTANFTMDTHDKGVNYVDFYPGPDRPYLQELRSDDGRSHQQSIFTVFHPNLPIIISGSEDGMVKIWNNNTYRLENTFWNGRVWCCEGMQTRLPLHSTKGSSSSRISTTSLLVVNPYKTLANANDISAREYEERCYKDTGLSLASSTLLQPHLYELAAQVYLLMRRTRQSQSVITRPPFFFPLQEGAKRASQVKALHTLLDAFGNVPNPNLSRHSRYLELHFNDRRRIESVKVLAFALDKSRIGRLAHEERTFHIFYQFLAGAAPQECDYFNVGGIRLVGFVATPCFRSRHAVGPSQAPSPEVLRVSSPVSLAAVFVHLAVHTLFPDIRRATTEAFTEAVVKRPQLHAIMAYLSKPVASVKAAVPPASSSEEQEKPVSTSEEGAASVDRGLVGVGTPSRNLSADSLEVLNVHVDLAMKNVLEASMMDPKLGFAEASYRAIGTLAFVAPQVVLLRVMDQLRVDIDAKALGALTEEDLGIWETPEGTTYVDGKVKAPPMSTLRSHPQTKHAFLLGGYAASDFLYRRLQQHPVFSEVHLCRPSGHPNKAVADGAVSSYVDPLVTSRTSRYTYGIDVVSPYNPSLFDHREREHTQFATPSGGMVLPNGFKSILLKVST
ncbi:WD40-repeat-containing domain protein [Boletus reticuloceps]|uniref:WD40-repeat-containing domain protein n=1 Tax=Boletus reticuloceps TaxID=495285 RepID=A0A8I2YHB8_9AGAM|nr:WD40-repeat-containing domain protein [Boletus reticuloceps]